MSVLFEPFSLSGLTLKNRFVRAATYEGMCTAGGIHTEAQAQLYERLAAARVGLILTGLTAVDPGGRSAPNTGVVQDSVEADSMLARLADRVHRHGAAIALQLAHAGRSSLPLEEGMDVVAPSPVPASITGIVPRTLETSEIELLVEKFAWGANKAKRLGFDAVEIHAAHGYLISNFLSPYMNQRSDAYGGCLENRARFLLGIIDAVRQAVGPGFPILVKLNTEDFVAEGGLTVLEACQIARVLEESGVDALELTGGTWDSEKGHGSIRKGIPQRHPEAHFRTNAEAIRKEVRLPLLLVGGIRSFETAEEIVSSGVVDLISLSRPLIHEPDLVARWTDGDRRPSSCVSCNRCLTLLLEKGFGCHKKDASTAGDSEGERGRAKE